MNSRSWLPCLTCWLVVSASAIAAPPPLIDAETGRDLDNWPRTHPFDHLHMDLRLEIGDPAEPVIVGEVTHRFQAIGRARGRLTLDAIKMRILDVAAEGRRVRHRHRGDRLEIELDPPAAPGTPVELTIRYRSPELRTDGVGLVWSARGDGDQTPQLHTQSASDHARRWVPCFDLPSDRLTTRITMVVPDGFLGLANGRLASQSRTRDGRLEWVWRQDQPHASYLWVFVVGQFETIQLGGEGSARPELDMPAYVPAGSGEQMRGVLGRTAEMIAFYERWTASPFPWDRYAQVVCRDFAFGGMENTTLTVLNGRVLNSDPGEEDDLIAHEIAHSWFGNLVTCRTWEHIWLNEGWATFCEALWFRHDAGGDEDVYAEVVMGWMDEVAQTTELSWPEEAPMASRRYAHADDTYGRPDDAYLKGALVLHMLRARLGSQVFREATRTYLREHRFGEVETDDFRRVLERVSGRSLERFFVEWVQRPGVPELAIEIEWDEGDRALRVAAAQTQPINEWNPAYTLRVPMRVTLSDGATHSIELDLPGREGEGVWRFSSAPMNVEVDPDATIVAAWDVDKPQAWWRWQQTHGAVYGRERASRELGLSRASPRGSVGCWCCRATMVSSPGGGEAHVISTRAVDARSDRELSR